MRLITTVVLALAALTCSAHAADYSVRVVSGAGAPVENAVVTFTRPGPAPAPIKFPWPYRVAQHDIQFEPRLLIVPVGATVSFPNLDKVRHHVYSFSTGNRFELKLYGKDESRTFTFNAAGVAAIGCNIHDQMSAFVVIVDTPYAAKTGADGVAVLKDASGAGELRVWHANLRAPGNRIARPATIGANGGSTTVTLDMRAADAAPMNSHSGHM